MKKLLITMFLLVPSFIFAQVSVGENRSRATEFIESLGGAYAKQDKNYLEASHFTRPIAGSKIKPKKIAIYLNNDDFIYLVIYTFEKNDDRNQAMEKVAKIDYDKTKSVTANENKSYLQLTRDSMSGEDAIFILMDTTKTLEFKAEDYAVFKKMVQSWQSGLNPAPKGSNFLGKTISDFKKLATADSPYKGSDKRGQIIFNNGEKINGFKPVMLDAVFDEKGVVVQTVWVFNKPKEWNDFLHKIGNGMDLLIQSDVSLQETLGKGETVEYTINKDEIIRFWYDNYGLGVAFANRDWISKQENKK